MSQISTPSRGQPLDVTYLSTIVNAVNDATTKVSSATKQNATIYKRTGGYQTVSNHSTKIVAGYANVSNNEQFSQDQVKVYTWSFPSQFLFAPIVVVTPQTLSNSGVGDNVIVTVRNVTTSDVEIAIRFNKQGSASLALNLIAMGLPQ